MSEMFRFPEAEGMEQAGVNRAELERIPRHTYASRYMAEATDGIDVLANLSVRRPMVELRDEPEKLVDITPPDEV